MALGLTAVGVHGVGVSYFVHHVQVYVYEYISFAHM